jgi:hypothetical protein
VPVAERRERLLSIFGNVAELGAERMEELAPHATLRDAGMAAGIATDRLLTLLGDGGGVPVQINMQVNARALHERFAQWTAALQKEVEAQRTKSPCQTAKRFRNLPAQWICTAAKKICKTSCSRRSLKGRLQRWQTCSNVGTFQWICSDFPF